MRVFYDVKIVERGNQLPIQLISAAYIGEDGRELYVINEECLTNVVRHPGLSMTVGPSLPITMDQVGDGNFITQWNPNHEDYANVFAMDTLVDRVKAFLLGCAKESKLEMWGYYAPFQYVAHCQLFGDEAALPVEFPIWTHDLMQVIETDPAVVLPPQPHINHHALWDARWTRDCFRVLNGQEPLTVISPLAPKSVDLEQ